MRSEKGAAAREERDERRETAGERREKTEERREKREERRGKRAEKIHAKTFSDCRDPWPFRLEFRSTLGGAFDTHRLWQEFQLAFWSE